MNPAIAPDAAFLLLCVGVSGVVLETLRPGLILPGVLGSGVAVAGVFLLLTRAFHPAILAVALFVALLSWGATFLFSFGWGCGVVASIMLAAALVQSGVHAVLAYSIMLANGAMITLLLRRSRRALANKAL